MALEVRISNHSELAHAQLYQIDGVTFWGRLEVPNIQPDQSDVRHTLTENDRMDYLASRYYGDPRLKYVIMKLNDMWLEPNDLIPGVEIRIPRFERLRSEGIVGR